MSFEKVSLIHRMYEIMMMYYWNEIIFYFCRKCLWWSDDNWSSRPTTHQRWINTLDSRKLSIIKYDRGWLFHHPSIRIDLQKLSIVFCFHNTRWLCNNLLTFSQFFLPLIWKIILSWILAFSATVSRWCVDKCGAVALPFAVNNTVFLRSDNWGYQGSCDAVLNDVI